MQPDAHPDLVRVLDDFERARLAQLRGRPQGGCYLAAHALTRLVLADRLGVPPRQVRYDRTCPCGGQHGKPRLRIDTAYTAAGSVDFSMTHTPDLVGVAVADAAVGLDVEKIRPLLGIATLSAQIYSPHELAQLREPAGDLATLFMTWTRKEALVKATGEGLRRPMNSITLDDTQGVAVSDWGSAPPAGPMWLVDLRPGPDHPAALAGCGTAPSAVSESDGYEVLAHARGVLD
ncbi:4'-phosphopantetheinyl transferase superfamily protein [Blastococcus montanus]|uniref:4'-phosphopantetheinyl transferase family protein n=1 Tax=Blastococcus montanus TaxID=3144973 RepID=UPI0032091099